MINDSTGTEKHLSRRRYGGRGRSQTWAFALMAVPAITLLTVFNYLPMIGTVIAFKDFRAVEGIFGSAWVGLKNFAFLFGSGDALRVTFNTLFLNGLFIVTGTVGAVIMALLLNELRVRTRWLSWLPAFYRSAVFFPFFISWVIVGYFTFAFLNADTGLVNQVLKGLGLAPVAWYSDPRFWPIILTLVNLWKNVGYGTVIYLSGMLAIDSQYYEAASLEGASKWQQIRFVTLPLIAPLVIITILLQIGRIFFADFGLFYNVTRDSSLLYPTTDVIDTYVFRALRTLGDFGMAGAAGLYQSFVGLILIASANWIVNRVNPESSIFARGKR